MTLRRPVARSDPGRPQGESENKVFGVGAPAVNLVGELFGDPAHGCEARTDGAADSQAGKILGYADGGKQASLRR